MFREKKLINKEFDKRDKERENNIVYSQKERDLNSEVNQGEVSKIERYFRKEYSFSLSKIEGIYEKIKFFNIYKRGSIAGLENQREKILKILNLVEEEVGLLKEGLYGFSDKFYEHRLNLLISSIEEKRDLADRYFLLKRKAVDLFKDGKTQELRACLPELFDVNFLDNDPEKLYHGIVPRKSEPGVSWTGNINSDESLLSVVEYADKILKIINEGLIPSDRNDQVYSDNELPAVYFTDFVNTGYGYAGVYHQPSRDVDIYRGGSEFMIYTTRLEMPFRIYVLNPESPLVGRKKEAFDLINELQIRGVEFDIIDPDTN